MGLEDLVSNSPLGDPGEADDFLPQFEDFHGAAFPVMVPADDQVAIVWRMAVEEKIAALKFKFNPQFLPLAGADLMHGLTIRKGRLDTGDGKAQFLGQHAKKKDDAGF